MSHQLKEAIDLISRGHEFFSPVVNEVIGPLRRDPKAYYRMLSDYEQQILGLIGESKSDRRRSPTILGHPTLDRAIAPAPRHHEQAGGTLHAKAHPLRDRARVHPD